MYPPQPPYAHYGPPPQRPSRAPVVLFGCLGAVVVGFALLFVIAVVAGTDPATTKRTSQAAASPAASRGKAAPSKTAAAAMPTIGDTVKDGGFSFKVTKFKSGPVRIGDQYAGHTAQGHFYYVYVTVKNLGDEPDYFSGSNQFLLAGNKQYAADLTAAAYLKDSDSLFTPINPGNEVDGIIVYDVPKSARPRTAEFHGGYLSHGVKVALY